MTSSSKIKIFTPEITPRVTFAFDFIIKRVLGLNYKIFDDKAQFKASAGYGIFYAVNTKSQEVFSIDSIGLLFSDEIVNLGDIPFKKIDGLQAFFATTNDLFPIDLPSCVFYLLSRYEEYVSNQDLDEHGRYQSKYSLACKNNFLEYPILDLWIERLAHALKGFYPDIYLPFIEDSTSRGAIECTFDIDFPLAYKHRSIFANLFGAVKDLSRSDKIGFYKRIAVVLGRDKDPYDQYDFIINALAKYSLVPHFFMLMRGGTEYDRNHFVNSQYFEKLIKKLSLNGLVGIHPSYKAIDDNNLLKEELILITKLISNGVRTSRMHFLKLNLPSSYRVLLEHGIYSDYTMGYADKVGFKSSTTHRHYWFDLESNESTLLEIVPLIVMDTTLHTYMSLSPEIALKKIKEMTHWVHKMKGNSSILWHNSGLSDWNHWKGWKSVFLKTIKYL